MVRLQYFVHSMDEVCEYLLDDLGFVEMEKTASEYQGEYISGFVRY